MSSFRFNGTTGNFGEVKVVSNALRCQRRGGAIPSIQSKLALTVSFYSGQHTEAFFAKTKI